MTEVRRFAENRESDLQNIVHNIPSKPQIQARSGISANFPPGLRHAARRVGRRPLQILRSVEIEKNTGIFRTVRLEALPLRGHGLPHLEVTSRRSIAVCMNGMSHESTSTAGIPSAWARTSAAWTPQMGPETGNMSCTQHWPANVCPVRHDTQTGAHSGRSTARLRSSRVGALSPPRRNRLLSRPMRRERPPAKTTPAIRTTFPPATGGHKRPCQDVFLPA